MEKKFKELRSKVQKILRNIKNANCDWTLQISLNSTEPNKVKYCCMIHIPTEGIAPITWVCDSFEELEQGLDKAVKELNADMVQIAWHQAELKKVENMKKYHEDSIKQIMEKNVES